MNAFCVHFVKVRFSDFKRVFFPQFFRGITYVNLICNNSIPCQLKSKLLLKMKM